MNQVTLGNTDFTCALVKDPEDMKGVYSVRMVVFVDEQQVPPEEELDAYDAVCDHFLVRIACPDMDTVRGIIATARLIDKGHGSGKIGRVAVLKRYRGNGVGRDLMKFVEQHAINAGFTELILEAQCHAIPFYASLGYTAEGDIFLDAGIEHRLMRKQIPADK